MSGKRHGLLARWPDCRRVAHEPIAGASRMRTHNVWHLAMFEIADGNVASALGILDAWLLPASAQSPLDACDATSLLWRLSTEGVDDEGRWRRISGAFEQALTPGFWPYVDLHAALAHMAAGQKTRTTGDLRQHRTRGRSPTTRPATRPASTTVNNGNGHATHGRGTHLASMLMIAQRDRRAHVIKGTCNGQARHL